MRYLIPIVVLVAGVCAAAPHLVAAQPDQAAAAVAMTVIPPPIGPDTVVRKFVSGLNATGAPNFYFERAPMVAGVQVGHFGGSVIDQDWVRRRGDANLKIERTEVLEVTPGSAKVRVSYAWINANATMRSESMVETLSLKVGAVPHSPNESAWYIVPVTDFHTPPTNETIATALPRPILEELAAKMADPAGALIWTRTRKSLSNLKHLALGALQLTQDYEGRFAFAPEFMQEALNPYTHDDTLWNIPGTKETYNFNSNLSLPTVNWFHFPSAEKTVLFYEGDNERPVYRYAGQAAIVFVDGHAALVKEEVAGNLIWKVK